MKKAKKPKTDSPILLIQKINLQWNKDCRGGAGAVLRNQCPQAALLPKNYFSYYPFGVPVHYLSLSQKTDGIHIQKEFRGLMKRRKDDTIWVKPFELSIKNKKAKICYCSDLHPYALPKRHKYDPATSRYVPLHETAFELEQGDYGRAVCNGRFVDWDTGDWWYEMDILNIILLSDFTAPLDCFLTGEPNKIYRQIARLW